jgi:hypothetical protein
MPLVFFGLARQIFPVEKECKTNKKRTQKERLS